MASVTVTARISPSSEQSTVQVLVFDTGGGVFAQGIVLTDTGGNPVSQATTLPAAGAGGVVTRPLAMSDGTHSMPTMDALNRPGFFRLTDGVTSAIFDANGFLKVNTAASATIPVTERATIGASTISQVIVDATTVNGVQLVAANTNRRRVVVLQEGTNPVRYQLGNITAASTSAGGLLVGVAGAQISLFSNLPVRATVASGTQGVTVIEEILT